MPDYSHLITRSDIADAIIEEVPQWLLVLSTRICATANQSKPKYGFSSRSVWASVHGLGATIYARSPHAELSALDFNFRVPAAGIDVSKYFDIFHMMPDITYAKGATTPMILMSNKPPETGSTSQLHPARYYTYTQHRGEIIRWKGYLSEAIREHIGWGAILSPTGRFNFQQLANKLAMNIANKIVGNVKAIAASRGMTIDTGPTPMFGTEQWRNV